MTENKINELLYSIPEGADYAAIPEELDKEDISKDRVSELMGLLHKNIEIFQVSKLLTAWGYDDGLDILGGLFDEGELEGYINHRIYGYDETLSYVLYVLTLYFANKSDIGEAKEADDKIYPYVCGIISASSNQYFELDDIKFLLKSKNVSDYHKKDYIRLIEQNLSSLNKTSDNYFWRIRYDIPSLEKFDPKFVEKFLKDNNIDMENYK